MAKPLRLISAATAALALAAATRTPPPKVGVADAGVKFPLARAVPAATFPIAGAPDWIAIDRDTWVSNKPKGTVVRIDPHANTIRQTIGGLNKPCSGLAVGFGSLWVPECGTGTVARINLHSGVITARIPAGGIADSEGGIATGAGSVWIMTDKKGTLARLDPKTDTVDRRHHLAAGCLVPAYGFGSVWITCPASNQLVRLDPSSGAVTQSIAVSPHPRFLAAGEGAVWTLNQGDGSVTRISPHSNRVEAIIPLGIPGPGGDISAADGSVWATAIGIPITRIDPATNRVTQQFAGKGGDAIRAGHGSLWLSNFMLGSEWRLDPKALLAFKATP